MRVSLIFTVLESYEMVRRQILYMNKLGLPDWMEVIFCDDCSEPPIIGYIAKTNVRPNFNHKFVYHNDPRPWTIASSFNYAVSRASGDYYMMTGIDHWISDDWVEWAGKTESDYVTFYRRYGLLDENGRVTDLEHMYFPISKNWASRSLFEKLNGYDAKFDMVGKEDLDLRTRYRELVKWKGGTHAADDTWIWMLPEKPDERRPANLLHSLPEIASEEYKQMLKNYTKRLLKDYAEYQE